MDFFDDGLRKLEIFERHECCESAIAYLRPPHQAGRIGSGSVAYNLGARTSWYLFEEHTDDEFVADIKFCPWCGKELEFGFPKNLVTKTPSLLRDEIVEIIKDEISTDYDGNVINADEITDLIIAKIK